MHDGLVRYLFGSLFSGGQVVTGLRRTTFSAICQWVHPVMVTVHWNWNDVVFKRATLVLLGQFGEKKMSAGPQIL